MRIGDWMVLGHWDGPMLGPGGSVHAGDSETIKKAELVGFELYNLREDLAQKKDLASTHPDRLKEMSATLVKKYREVRDEGPVWKIPARRKKK